MKTETLEKATALKRQIDHLESIAQMLTNERSEKNPNALHLGISREEYSMHYLPLNNLGDLSSQLLEVVSKYIHANLPALKKQLQDL